MPALIDQRAGFIDDVETAASEPVSPLQPAEAKQYADKLKALPPEARAEALAATGSRLSLPRINALAAQLDKSDKPLALSLKLGADRTTAGRATSELVLRGAQALADKTVKRDDAVLTGWKAEIAGMVRGTLGDDAAESDVIDSAYYVRAAMDSDGTAAPGFNLDASNRSAVRLVIGEPLERNGVKTLLPRGMDEGAFDKALEAYTPDKLRTMVPDTLYVRGKPVTLDRFSTSLTNYGMRRDGKGNYLPVSGGAFVTTDKEGRNPIRLPIR